jgi:hypothetical protein
MDQVHIPVLVSFIHMTIAGQIFESAYCGKNILYNTAVCRYIRYNMVKQLFEVG